MRAIRILSKDAAIIDIDAAAAEDCIAASFIFSALYFLRAAH
jgi:hypothetical protein